ncbi:MAG: hypothetical protein DPW09_18040 [Anaerolineae bacterium]|nr:protein kinase [Anaerolineales bacterium]MCQ3975348.1 hypothetical protein [Anaerolineae bacterium]
MPLILGEILNERYRIDKLVGQGGFGAVYQAYDLALRQVCAIKENLNAEPEAQRQFEREALILARLRHPNLPRVIDHFTRAGQSQYLVMDFVEGHSLFHLLRAQARPLSEEAALAWIDQVCQALAYLHRQDPPIIHRDIKPQNIIITPAGRAMLVDFGLSKLYDEQLKTTTGAQGVTFGYAPPEQYGRGRTDARSDIYALGATLYTMLTGQRPPDAIDRLVHEAPLTPPRRYSPQLSPHVEQAVLKAMELTTARRFDSVEMFRRALTEPWPPAMEPIQPPEQTPELAVIEPKSQPSPAKRGWLSPVWLGVMAVGVVVLAGLTTMGLTWVYQGVERVLANAPSPTVTTAQIVKYQLMPSPTPVSTTRPSPPATATLPPPTRLPATATPLTPTPTPLPPTATSTPPPVSPLISSFLFTENNKLVRMNADGATVTLAELDLEIPPFTPISLSSDGRHIALAAQDDSSLQSELYIANLDGSGLIHLTGDNSYSFGSSWSPDGARLALLSGPEVEGNRLYVVNADGSNRQLIGPETIELPIQDPIWLPDSQHILFKGLERARWQLYLIQADGANLTCLTCDVGLDPDPTLDHILSANGQQFIYENGDDIYIRDIEGGEPRNLTANLDKDVSYPGWSPDQQRIAFGAYDVNSGEQSIYVVNPDGSNLNQLPIPALGDIVWSPDGQRIAFVSAEGLHVINADGTQRLKLTPDNFSVYQFDWSPDGQQLLFSSNGGVQGNEADFLDNFYNTDFFLVQADGSHLTRLTQTLNQKNFISWLPN